MMDLASNLLYTTNRMSDGFQACGCRGTPINSQNPAQELRKHDLSGSNNTIGQPEVLARARLGCQAGAGCICGSEQLH